MNDLQDALITRKKETELVIDQIEKSKFSDKTFNKNNSIQKALVFLMCYNAIESTVFLSLQWLFDEIKINCTRFSELNSNIQRIYNRYYLSPKYSSCSTTFEERHRLSFEDYSKIVITFFGNLDARKIRGILSDYGISNDFHVKGESELLKIKSYRNQLTHGEVTFNGVGRNYTILDICKIQNIAFDFLEQYEKSLTEYITNKKYFTA